MIRPNLWLAFPTDTDRVELAHLPPELRMGDLIVQPSANDVAYERHGIRDVTIPLIWRLDLAGALRSPALDAFQLAVAMGLPTGSWSEQLIGYGRYLSMSLTEQAELDLVRQICLFAGGIDRLVIALMPEGLIRSYDLTRDHIRALKRPNGNWLGPFEQPDSWTQRSPKGGFIR